MSVYKFLFYDSGLLYVIGVVCYVDDILMFKGMLYFVFGLLIVVNGMIIVLDLLDVICSDGVSYVFMVEDLFFINDVSLLIYDELFLVDKMVYYVG